LIFGHSIVKSKDNASPPPDLTVVSAAVTEAPVEASHLAHHAEPVLETTPSEPVSVLPEDHPPVLHQEDNSSVQVQMHENPYNQVYTEEQVVASEASDVQTYQQVQQDEPSEMSSQPETQTQPIDDITNIHDAQQVEPQQTEETQCQSVVEVAPPQLSEAESIVESETPPDPVAPNLIENETAPPLTAETEETVVSTPTEALQPSTSECHEQNQEVVPEAVQTSELQPEPPVEPAVETPTTEAEAVAETQNNPAESSADGST